MKTIVLLLATLTLAPVTGLAADAPGTTGSAVSSVQCLLDPAPCKTVERTMYRR